MDFERLFPEQFRAFCSGPLSLCMERFGGIDSISLLDVRSFGGKDYPDRFPLPWLKRDGSSTLGRPLYSPAVQFRHGKEMYYPTDVELFPNGMISDGYSMLMDRNCAVFRFRAVPGERFSFYLSALHMPEGTFPSLKNQCSRRESGIQWLPDELRGPGFDPSKPFPDGEMIFRRNAPEFGKDHIVFSAHCTFSGYEKDVFWAIRFPQRFSIREIPNGFEFYFDAELPSFEVGFGFGDSREDALRNGETDFSRLEANLKKLRETKLEAEIEGMPVAADFIRTLPAYQRSLLVTENESEATIRAAADRFGFFAMWDHIYPSRDFLFFGEPERTKKLLRFMIRYPWAETCPWITIHLIIQTNEYLAFTHDLEFLKESMPRFREFFRFNKSFVNARTGFLASSLNMGMDNSKEAGLGGLFYPVCINGWWYDSLRSLENFARETGDDSLAEECREIACRIETDYEQCFYDEKEKYLKAAIGIDGKDHGLMVYQNTHTIGMDYVHGPWLFRRIIRRLAAYQAERLYHPCGHTAVSFDSEVPCEMWKSVHMNQHIGHECKVARFGGLAEEAERVMTGYLSYFGKYRTAVETFNLAGCDGDSVQLANWQAFSSTGALQGLVGGVMGWLVHRGGFSWIPAAGPRSEIRNLNGKVLSVSGNGKYSSGLEGVPGSLQEPADLNMKSLRVIRSEKSPEHPVLIFAADLPVSGIRTEGKNLSFRTEALRRAPVMIFSPELPDLRINGISVDFEWDPAERILWFDHLFRPGDLCEVIAEQGQFFVMI